MCEYNSDREIILWGGGIRGIKTEDILYKHGIVIRGFADSNKEGYVISNERKYPVYNIKWIKEHNCQVVISIADNSIVDNIKRLLLEEGIEITTIEQLLYGDTNNLVINNREFIAEYHDKEMQDYFAKAEEQLEIFWNNQSVFKKYFDMLDTRYTVELACGHGRHVHRYIDRSQNIYLVDVSSENITFCKNRFKDEKKIYYIKNDGHTLNNIENSSVTSLFTYDSMVHFEMIDIFDYLRETYRILQPGGKALFHHSNNDGDYMTTFATGTCGRNYMSKDLFGYLVNRAGLKIIAQEEIDWEGHEKLDCLTLVQK